MQSRVRVLQYCPQALPIAPVETEPDTFGLRQLGGIRLD